MKIVRLNLDAFGPFSGDSLDLSAGRPGLHLVYGPNEAGKSSALRAIGNLFYGIPVRSTDAFLFEYNKMRLSARLEHSDGSILEFVRFKRTKNPLCEADGSTPLDASKLERFLGGVDESLFKTMFGIGHDALIEGGKEILNGGGKLGEVLFAASSGIAGLKGIQDALKNDREALFNDSGRGKIQKIPLAIADVREAQSKIKEVTVTTEDFLRQEKVVIEARLESQRLEELRREKGREASRLRRIQGALRHIPERASLIDQLKGLQGVILLDQDFADRRARAEKAQALADQESERARQAIDGLVTRRDAIARPGPILGVADLIEDLHGRRVEYRKAQADRPLRARDLQEHEHAARDLLQSLGRPRDLAAAEGLQPRADDPVIIGQLALKAGQLITKRDEIRETIARHKSRSEKNRQNLADLEATLDVEPLRATVKSALKLGDIEAQRDQCRQAIDPLNKALKAAQRKLNGWSGSLEELEELAVPPVETIARFEARFELAEARNRALEADRSREARAIAELEARLQSESSQRDLPTEDELARARDSRDEGWRLIRRAWLDGLNDPEATAAFIAEHVPGRTLADAFERQVSKSDALADRLRREAGDVARRAEQLANLEGRRGQLDRIDREQAEAKTAFDKLMKEWDAETSPSGVVGLNPSEWRAWLDRRDKVLEALSKVRLQQAEVDRLDGLAADRSSRLFATLTGLGIPADSLENRLVSLIERAQSLIAQQEKLGRRREALETDLAKEQTDLGVAEANLARVEADREESRVVWAENMRRIGLEPEATPEQATVFVEKIRELRVQLTKAQQFRTWITKIDGSVERFNGEVAELLGRVAPDLLDQPPDSAIETLYARLKSTRDDDQNLRLLGERIEAEQAALETAERSKAEARLELADLCRRANCPNADGLAEAERLSRLRAKAEADLERSEEQIRGLSAGSTIEAFLDEAAKVDPDSLDLVLDGLDREVAELQEKIAEVNQKIGAENRALEAIDGGGKAAEANDQAGYALARLQSDVPRYAALRIAAYVLQQGIERYRDRAQGPLIQRASQLFARLTAGSFGGLRVDYGDDGAFLAGVRPDGETLLQTKHMSDGSCDQLYLALRIASLENWLAAHEPIPLIVDDILLQFDNDRSVAALQVLGELAQKTQVIFFTHHAHLIELAQANLANADLVVHHLPAGMVRA